MVLAIVLFAISTGTVLWRWRNPDVFESSGKVLYYLGYVASFGIALVLAFLGGVILYGF
jgi:hypothetical protein